MNMEVKKSTVIQEDRYICEQVVYLINLRACPNTLYINKLGDISRSHFKMEVY